VQTTLLAIAIAIILALLAALVAPLVIDWNHYRSAFEDEVGRLTGLSVRVGSIDARILPSPIVKLRDVAIGEPGHEPLLRAAALELEVRLAPLVRGQVQANEARLVSPQLNLALDSSGTLQLPALAGSFSPEEFSVSRLSVRDGSIVLADAASGARAMLQKLTFEGDVRSLIGPFRGEGSFAANGEPFSYRISGALAGDGSGFRIRLGADPQDFPLTTNLEGSIAFDRGVPQLAGTFTLVRPVGVTLSNGERVMSDPWRATGAIKATPASASLDEVAFQYGPDERAVNVSGKADIRFGQHSHFSGEVKALEVDVDRALAAPDITHRPPLLVVKSFAEALVAATKLPMPGDVAVSIDGLTVGGTSIQSVQGKLRFDEGGWSLESFGFRAPGLTDINLSGRLAPPSQGFAFTGPVAVQSADAATLIAWLGGRSAQPSGQTGTLAVQGDLTIASDKVAIDRLTAQLNRESLDGRFAYGWPKGGRPAIVEADLHATTLDVDALTDLAKSAVDTGGVALPRAGSLALDIGKATFAGVDAQAVKTQMTFDAGALQIGHLSIGALAGAAIDINGRIDELSSRPKGRITVDLDARTLDGLAALAGKFSPQAADVLRRAASRLSPAKVHGVVTVEQEAAAGSNARLDLNGQLGLIRVTLDGAAKGEPSHLGAAQLHVDGKLDADDGTALTALFGIDRVVGVDQLPGRATLLLDGPLNGDLRIDGNLAGSGLNTAVRGTLSLGADPGPGASVQMLATVADLRPLQKAMTGQAGEAVPVSARAALAISGAHVAVTQIAVASGKAAASGRLDINLATPVGVDGDIAADHIDGARIAALLLGLPSQAPHSTAVWSNQPVGVGAFAAINGAISFKLDHAAFAPVPGDGSLKGIAQFHSSEIVLDNLDGELAGGHLTGQLAFRHNADGLVSHGHVELADADAAVLLQADPKTVAGRLTLKLDGDSIGASSAAVVAALHGGGSVSLNGAHIAGLDSAAFVAAMRAADQAKTIDPAKIAAAATAALANGHLDVPQGEAPVTIAGGKAGVANVVLHAQEGSALALAGTFDLNTGAVDARLILSSEPPPHALINARPELAIALKGPLAAPARSLDVSALTGWLALRAAELQTRRLELIEVSGRKDVLGRGIRPDFTTSRGAPYGALSESGIQVGTAAPAAKLDLLQHPVPAAADAVGQVKPSPSLPASAVPRPQAPLDLLRPQN
jgi:large subunit ribosomal protein L24